jgi:hypothetical protein
MTVDSIVRNAREKPKITLINNGWNAKIVPSRILGYWQNFVQEYTDRKIVADVYETEHALVGGALESLALPRIDLGERYHFITDNDCVIKKTSHGNFDSFMSKDMDENPELIKLGAFLYRSVSSDYCREFEDETISFRDYLPFSPDDPRIKSSRADMQDIAQWKGQTAVAYRPSSNVYMMASDTTLSIIRNPRRFDQEIRISPSTKSAEILHIGYLEPYFFNSRSRDAVLEMIFYHLVRPKVLTEFTADYELRANLYCQNLIRNGHQDLVNEVFGLIGL